MDGRVAARERDDQLRKGQGRWVEKKSRLGIPPKRIRRHARAPFQGIVRQ